MDIRKNMILCGLSDLLVLVVFFLTLNKQTVVTQLVFSILPIIVNVVIMAVINRKIDGEKNNLKQGVLLCTILLVAVLVVEYFAINMAGVNDIDAFSKQVSSEYVTVSKNSNPLFSVFIFALGSFLLNYNLLKRKEKKFVEEVLD